MSDISPERNNIQQEETAAEAAVSESTLSRVGGSINFINDRQAMMWQFNINGRYARLTVPFLRADGMLRFPFPWEIVDVFIVAGELTGSSGSTQFDLKWAAHGSNTFVSAFTVKPAFTSSAQPFADCGIGQTVSQFTAPVMARTQFDAYDRVRFDITAVPGGIAEGANLGINFKPR